MRYLAPLLLATIGSCASANTTPTPSTPAVQTVRVASTSVGTTSMMIISNDGVHTMSVPYTVEKVWAALPAVYDSLGIPRADFDAKERVIGNHGLKVMRRLGGTALSKYLDCGRGQMEANADSYDVFLSVLTRVSPVGDAAASIATTLEAQARPVAFAGDYVHCTSKGELEQRIVDITQRQVWR